MKLVKYLSLFGILIIVIILATSLTAQMLQRQLGSGTGPVAVVVSATKQFDYDLQSRSTRSSDIFYLQEFLRGFGFFTYSISTGTYGHATADAVARFQRANNIPATGIFNTLTRTLANRIIVAKNIKFTTPTQNKVVTPVTPITPKPITTSATSTAKGVIKIASIMRAGAKPDGQFIVIRNNAGKNPVDITGFTITTSQNNQFLIPKAHTIPGINSVARDNIVLKPGESVKIIVGRQVTQINFQENICTGYFDEKVDYGGNLSHNCPKPDYTSRISVLSDYCTEVFDKTPICKTVDVQKTQQPACMQFSVDHFNYQGCLKDFKNKTGFLKGNWLVWMQRNATFFRQLHDIVILYDKEGKIVDQFTY
ncbi:MAG: peptidoglycan-binding protein [Patescibacteria group bacterium]